MLARFLCSCGLSAWILCAQVQPPVRSWTDAEKLEAELDSHPDDVNLHLQLLRFYAFQTRDAAERGRLARRKHLLWFIENHPEHSELANSTCAVDSAADPDGFSQASAAWQKALAAPKPLFDAYANAIAFYKIADPDRARRIAEDGLKRYPGNARISNRKGMLMAYAITGAKTVDQNGQAASFDESASRGPLAFADRRALESSDDTNLIDGAAQVFQQQIDPLHSHGLTALLHEIEELVVRLYQHADSVDPNFGRWRNSLALAYKNFARVAATPSAKIALLEKALAVAAGPNAYSRASVLPDIAEQYLAAGETTKAIDAAKELLNDPNQSNPNYGYNVFTGNLLLGRAALKQGDAQEAARLLVAAGRAPANYQLSAFGPTDWRLAEDLLAAGERDSVLAYLDLLRGLWRNDNGRLNNWSSTIRAGGAPSFTGVAFPRDRYIGRPAPDFRLKDLKDAEVSLADTKGKVVLLDFWATWCGPCRQEMPEFQSIHRELGSQDVVVLAVDVDEPLETITGYLDKEKFTFPVLLAKNTDVMERYSVHAYPTTFVIDAKGLVVDVLIGGAPNRLRPAIDKARAGAPAPSRDSAPPPIAAPHLSPPTSSETAEDFYRDAVRQRSSKNYADAIRSLDRAIELRPDWLLAVVSRADNLYHAKRYDEAIAGYTRAIEIDPKRAASYDSRGLALSYSRRHAAAIPDYTRAIDLGPTSTAYNNRGWAYLETDRLEESLADLNKALELNPANSQALFNRAHLFEKCSDWGKAIADFDSVLHLEPSNEQATVQKAADLRRLEAAAHPLILPGPGTPTGSQARSIHCQGRLDIAQTFTWSLDDCQQRQQARSYAEDLWFEAVDPHTRFIAPRPGVLLAVAGDKSIGYDGCAASRMTNDRVSLDTLTKGTFICVKTTEGRIAEFSFDDLYAKNPAMPSVLTLAITVRTWE